MEFDVAIIGAGLVGSALARALGSTRLACALVDAAAPPAAPGEAWDARVYALSPASQALLESIGAWQALDPARIAPVRRMRVTGDDGASTLEFCAHRSGVERLATIVESGRLRQALWQALRVQPNLTVLAPQRPVALAWRREAASLALESGGELRARLLVGADGVNSWVRSAAGVRARQVPIGQRGVVANFACELAHEDTAFQWFRADGILAWLPLPGERFSMVWSTSDAHAAELAALDAAALAGRVAAAGGRALGSLRLLAPAASFPLVDLSVARRVRPRLALLGDAAHAIHPLAGQGVNLGFGDVRCLARLLRAAGPAPGGDPGDLLRLRAFERERAEDILAMRLATRALRRLFDARSPALARIRNAGLNLSGRMPVVARSLAQRAMGLGGNAENRT